MPQEQVAQTKKKNTKKFFQAHQIKLCTLQNTLEHALIFLNGLVTEHVLFVSL